VLNPHKRPFFAVVVLAALTACGDLAPSTGTLEVILNLSQAPGITPDVLLKGPNGSEKSLTASHNDPEAKAGDYTLVVRDVSSGGYLSKGSASEASFKLEPKGSKSVSASYQTWGKANITIEVVPSSSGFSPTLILSKGSNSQNLSASGAVNLEPGAYTVSASDAPANYIRTLAVNSLNIVGGQTATLTLRYERQSGIVLGATGLPNGATVYAVPVGGGTTVTGTYSGTTLNLNTTTPGQYNLSAIVAGQIVDSLYVVEPASAATITVAANQQTSANLTFRKRAGTGRIWVAGNGGFSNGGRGSTAVAENNAAYFIDDATAASSGSFTPFINPSASQGVFRIQADRDGNLYVLFQFAGSGTAPQILRISESNLLQGLTGAGNPGNTLIAGSVWAWQSGNVITDTPGSAATGNNEPADMAFDRNGNLWVINDNVGIFACVAASKLRTAPATITASDAQIWGPGTGLYTYVLNTAGQTAENRPFMIPHALIFDGDNNLWFTAGGFQGPRGGAETTPVKKSTLNRIPTSRISYAANGDCNGGALGITPANLGQYVDIRLNHSLETSDLGAIVKPVTLALDPSGNAIWVGDFGGNSGGSGDFYRDANATTETAIRIPITGLSPSASLQSATVSHRFTVSTGSGTDKGLQQVFGLNFDKNGNLWAAANNNVEILTTDGGAAAAGLTDRRGKLYQLDVRNLSSFPTYNGSNTVNLRAQNLVPRTLSVTDIGVGLIGVFLNLPNPATPLYLR
jgi:hypothetical protein